MFQCAIVLKKKDVDVCEAHRKCLHGSTGEEFVYLSRPYLVILKIVPREMVPLGYSEGTTVNDEKTFPLRTNIQRSMVRSSSIMHLRINDISSIFSVSPQEPFMADSSLNRPREGLLRGDWRV